MRLPIILSTLIFLLTTTLQAQSDSKVVTGVVLLNDNKPIDFKTLADAAKKDWGIYVDSFNQAEKTLVLYTASATIMLAHLDYPLPLAEIKSAAEGAWMWRDAGEEAPRHQSQVVVSVIGPGSRPVRLYQLFTRAAAAVLDNTRSSGVYMNTQLVLQSKAFYLQSARNLDQQVMPVYCWVYFGMFQDGGQSCAYTYGLNEFGMTDLEIVKSKHSMQEAHAVLYDAVKDALQNNSILREGSTVETLDGEKVTLTRSKSVYLEGETLKVAY